MAVSSNHTVLIIADDLTGAADSTTAFARQGFATRVIVDAANWSFDDIKGYDVVAFSTETRNLSVKESVSIVAPLAKCLADLKPRLILKKIDSTFRGQVLAETLAMLEELGLDKAVIASAHPLQRRTISNGAIFVDGIPLRDTSYARHKTPPPHDIPAAVRQVFGDTLVFNGLSTKKLPEKPLAGVYLPDISQEEDLTRTARWIIAQGEGMLPVGSAGLANAFARFLLPPNRSGERSPTVSKTSLQKILIVIGSPLPEVSNQLRTLSSARQDVAILDVANGNRIDFDASALKESVIVLRMVRGTTMISHIEAATNLAETTRHVMDSQPIEHLITVGGDTSRSVLRTLGVAYFNVMPQDVAGLPRGQTQYNGRPLTFVAKPAPFSEPAIFASIADELLSTPKETDK